MYNWGWVSEEFGGKSLPSGSIDGVNDMSCLVPYFTDEDITMMLLEYDEQAFVDLPHWLQEQLIVRNITFVRRQPTLDEIDATVSDAREHRITNHELEIQDYKDKYLHGRSFTIT